MREINRVRSASLNSSSIRSDLSLRSFRVNRPSFCSISGYKRCQQLRFADSDVLVVPRTKTSIARSFAVIGPEIWSSLPVDWRLCDLSSKMFAKRLNTYLFEYDCCLQCSFSFNF